MSVYGGVKKKKKILILQEANFISMMELGHVCERDDM